MLPDAVLACFLLPVADPTAVRPARGPAQAGCNIRSRPPNTVHQQSQSPIGTRPRLAVETNKVAPPRRGASASAGGVALQLASLCTSRRSRAPHRWASPSPHTYEDGRGLMSERPAGNLSRGSVLASAPLPLHSPVLAADRTACCRHAVPSPSTSLSFCPGVSTGLGPASYDR
ncbi:hypothetical protein CSOJ01_03815 [Colletotrichum sojae]|uniref:Uncharacterized protein n=1 Tax=Colletotrichum sojae TaxID=2175907 RepID=A0A8H6MZH9_9PEZI|nr:hypothetical protein CSOJ01_03815 [Colletotrichum sojae]